MMTDKQIDALIDVVKPEIRVAIRAIQNGQAVHLFNLFDWRNSKSGAQTKIVMIVAHEAPAALLEAAARGLRACSEIYARILKEAEGA